MQCQKNRLDVVRESCFVWTNRLYRMTQNDGNYLREYKAACLIENREMNLFIKRSPKIDQNVHEIL